MNCFLKKSGHIIAVLAGLLFARCAQVGVLSGGQRDLTPPKLVEAIPANASRNVTGNTIELKFDEFVQVRDIANQVVITPQTNEMPSIEARGKRVTVQFAETLKPNTTYRIFFGGSIADMHEANAMSDFEYVFSTGATLDSLKQNGKVINAYNLKAEKEVIVGLYDKRSEDSVIFKSKPMYFTKTDANGNYKMSYLPKDSFLCFAFSDKNKNLLYDGGEEMVAFKDSLIKTGTDTTVNLKLFKEEPKKRYVKRIYSPHYGVANIIYNKETDYKVAPLYKEQSAFIMQSGSRNDTCTILYHAIYDSLKVLVGHINKEDVDTVTIKVLSEEDFIKQRKSKKLRLEAELAPLEAGKLKFTDQPQLVFNKWIDFKKSDSTRIVITSKTDSLTPKTVSITEAGMNKVKLNTKLKQGTEYTLVLLKGAFTDKDSLVSDSMVKVITTTKEDNYGNLGLKLVLPKKESYIVQLVNEQERVMAEQYVSTSLASTQERTLNFKLLLPGEYFVKLIEDSNANKMWDTGDYFLKKHPETIYFNTQAIKLLADWDADIEWKVNE